jgi:hypothetical protein
MEKYNSSEDTELPKIGILKNHLSVNQQLLSRVAKSVKENLTNQHDTSGSKWGTYVNDFSAIDGLEPFCRSFVDS